MKTIYIYGTCYANFIREIEVDDELTDKEIQKEIFNTSIDNDDIEFTESRIYNITNDNDDEIYPELIGQLI